MLFFNIYFSFIPHFSVMNLKLGDFGVAKQLEKTTASITRKGTYEYMSPEVYHSQKCDSRADIYSLAIVLYRLFNKNNRLPFLNTEKQMITYSEREDAFNRRIKGEKIPALNEVDENINITLLRALEYRKEDRFKNVEEFETALKRCARGKRAKKSFKQIVENSVITKAVSIILVAAIVSTTLAVYLNHRPAPKKEPETIIVNESTTATTTSTTKESTTKSTTEKAKTTTSLKVDDSFSRLDEDNLRQILEFFVWFGFFSENNNYSRVTLGEKNYDCTTSDAVKFAYNTMFGGYYVQFYKELAYIYDPTSYKYSGFDYAYEQKYNFIETVINDFGNKVENPDPKNRFNNYYGYEKIDAEYIDQYFEAVFNIKPNHSLDFNGYLNNTYYYNGYYYSKIDQGGDGAAPAVYINEIKKSKNGKYIITASYSISRIDNGDYNEEINGQVVINEHMYDLKVTADQKLVNGNKVWSFYKIEEI